MSVFFFFFFSLKIMRVTMYYLSHTYSAIPTGFFRSKVTHAILYSQSEHSVSTFRREKAFGMKHLSLCIYIYMCVCVCVCLSVWEVKRGLKENQTKQARDKDVWWTCDELVSCVTILLSFFPSCVLIPIPRYTYACLYLYTSAYMNPTVQKT